MRRACTIAVLVLGVALVASVSEAAPTLDLQVPASGERVRLTPGDGTLHLVFFATWCPSCVDELESLADFEARWEERGYRLVLVAVETRHTRQRLARFAEDRELPGRLLFDDTGQAAGLLKAEQLPMHIVFAADGQELARADDLAGIRQAVEDRLLGEDAPRRTP